MDTVLYGVVDAGRWLIPTVQLKNKNTPAYPAMLLETFLRQRTNASPLTDAGATQWLAHGSPHRLDILEPMNGSVYASAHLIAAFFLGLRHLHPDKNIHWGSYQLRSGEMRYFASAARSALLSLAIDQPIFIHLCDPASFKLCDTVYTPRVTRYSYGQIQGPTELVSSSAVRPHHVFSMRLSDLAVSAHPDHESRSVALLLHQWRLARRPLTFGLKPRARS
jgi:hypothetical protein